MTKEIRMALLFMALLCVYFCALAVIGFEEALM